ncbi:MAG: rhomboid family intramembrane serine protease, partial [Deltaproteobacteria bacterium]
MDRTEDAGPHAMSPSYRYQRGIGMPSGLSLGPPGPVPPVVKGLIIANTAVYLLQILTPHYVLVAWFGLIPWRVIGGLELWRVFTYQFLHGGVWHLALNMLVLWMFGTELEQRWGQRFFLKYYMLCAVGGGLTYTLVRAGSSIPSVGASGAIYGVLLAYGMWFPNRVVLLAFLFPIRVRHLIVFLIVLELLQAMESTGAGIAYAAHLGGMAVGYVYLRWWI